MITEILSTGDEVRSGAIADSNAAYIAQRIESEAGLPVSRHSCVGDDIKDIAGILREIGARADIALVTGGLGPTSDDLTAEAAALAAGVNLNLNETALGQMEAFFKMRNYTLNSSNRKQAILPEGAEVLYNPVGTAPGFALKIGKCLFFFMPGVPSEMKKMLADRVLPKIAELQGKQRHFCVVKTISTFGLPESTVGERLAGLTEAIPEIRLGLRALFPEIQVKLYVEGDNQAVIDSRIEKAVQWILQQIGDKVISLDGSSMEAVIGKLLKEKNATLSVAESCTGGLISHRLTDVAGSSDYFLFSGVTYSNEAKIKVLGVSPDTLRQYGAVHEETAKEMALGVKRLTGSTYGLSTSGIAGPGGGTKEKPVGTVCIGLATPREVIARRFHFSFGIREMNKTIFAVTAMELLRRELKIEK